MNTSAKTKAQEDLDKLLSISDVDVNELLAIVPSLIAAGGDAPPQLVALLAKAAGVRDSDDDATAAAKITAFCAEHGARAEVEQGLFMLASGKAFDTVKAGAQEAFAKFADAPAERPGQSEPDGAKKGMSMLSVRTGATHSNGDKGET